MLEYLNEMNKLCSKQNRTQVEEQRLKDLLLREKLETDVMLHPEDYEV